MGGCFGDDTHEDVLVVKREGEAECGNGQRGVGCLSCEPEVVSRSFFVLVVGWFGSSQGLKRMSMLKLLQIHPNECKLYGCGESTFGPKTEAGQARFKILKIS